MTATSRSYELEMVFKLTLKQFWITSDLIFSVVKHNGEKNRRGAVAHLQVVSLV